MYFGFAISVVMHVGLLVWALINIHATPPFKVSGPEPVEVALITTEDLVRLKKGNRRSKKLETQQAKTQDDGKSKKKAKPKIAPPPTAAAPPPEPPKPPEPVKPAKPRKDEIAAQIAMLQKKEAQAKKLEEYALKKAALAKKKTEAEEKKKKKAAKKKRREAERKKKLAKKKKAEAKRKAAEKRRRAKKLAKKKRRKKLSFEERMDAAMNKALLDKDPTRRNTRGGSAEAPKTRTKARGANAGAPEGTDDRLTSSQRAMLGLIMKTATSRCWRINSGTEGVQNIVVKVDVRLKPDGSLAGEPRLVTRGSGALFRDVANAAVRAVVGCAPYDLPKNLYKDGWDYMRVTFDPRNMY